MLETLKIKNFALIEDETIEFKSGFNVLVGETGAGKSLILDALNFVLGEKANKLNIRNGKDKMFVQAVFANCSEGIQNILDNFGIDIDDCLIVSRTYNIDGKSECRLNGVIVPISAIKSVASLLVDTCGQNENVELLKVKNHITILDAYAEDKVKQLKIKLLEGLNKQRELDEQMSKIGGNSQGRQRELELLEYQIKDIENANILPNEEEDIKNQINKLVNAEKIVAGLKNANSQLNNVSDLLLSVHNSLNISARYDEQWQSYAERISSAKIELEDVNDTIYDNLNSVEFDESKLEQLYSRQEIIRSIKKKYGASIEEVFDYLLKIKEDYDNLLFGEEKLKKLEKEYIANKKDLYDICIRLSEIRKRVATEIENNVVSELQLLGFKNARFKINFANLPNIDNASINKNGLDDVEFMLSANAGQELKSLSKTISGGEMSRFMLAIKSVFAKYLNNSTLIFDEIDTGISGEIGQKVAERLAVLSVDYQLICITHMCQVTAMADNYIFVKKEVVNNNTFTKVSYLYGGDLIKYIATVSGAQPTEVAIQFATELKNKAENFKKQFN